MITTTTIKSHNQVGVRMNLTRGLINLIIEIYEDRLDVYAGFINELYYMESARPTRYSPTNWTTEMVNFYASIKLEDLLRELAREMAGNI